MHQRFIDAINSDPDDRATQLIYADWLDQQGDPRAEAWRVLIEEGKRPFWAHGEIEEWDWYTFGNESSLPHEMWHSMQNPPWDVPYGYPTFFSAMDAAAIAWVRCHRDPEFLRETTPA